MPLIAAQPTPTGGYPFGEAVQILTGGARTDPYSGDPVFDDWDNPTAVEVSGVAVEPRPSDEPVQDARNAVTSGFTLYFPPGTEIGPQNRVGVRFGVYEVLGEPAVWRSPFTGWEPGVVVQVGRTEG